MSGTTSKHDHPHGPSAQPVHDDHGHAAQAGASHEDHHDSHEHGHSHDDHGHDHGSGPLAWLAGLFHIGGHDHAHGSFIHEDSFAANSRGIRVIWLALASLVITSVIQVVIVLSSHSVALLADTAHNIGDALNSVPLLIAFYLARRAATRRYTYGFGRAEDLAGIVIVLSIAVSAGIVFWEAIDRFLHPQEMAQLGWVAAAAVVGFLGNEAVALLQIRTGRSIGSAAMVADGLHARTDGLTSLAVAVAAAATWLGFPIVDPIIGVLIGVAILFITRDAVRTMWYRLMDAVDPALVDKAEAALRQQAGVAQVERLQLRWLGHQLYGEALVALAPETTVAESAALAERVAAAVREEIPQLVQLTLQSKPQG